MTDNKIPRKPSKGVLDIITKYLEYDSKTGYIKFSKDFRYRKKGYIADVMRNSDKASNRYLCVSFYIKDKKVLIFSHHIVYFIKTGKWPTSLIDHRDGDGTNNKWENIRIADGFKNQANRKVNINNTSGVKGVHLHRSVKKSSGKIYEYWYAEITINNKIIYLGRFKTLEEAKQVRIEAEHKYFGEWSYLNR